MSKSKTEKLLPLDQQVRGQLHALSQALEETARQYVLRLQREIAELSNLVPIAQGKKGQQHKRLKKLSQMIKVLSALQIKPNKGRRKDLKRIDELIGELENMVHDR
jgi:hypothetical protein